MRISPKALAMAVGFALATTVGLSAGQGSGRDEYVVQQSRGAPTVSLGGTVVPYKEVTLAAQVPGRVKYLAGIEGDTFKEGTLLVALDDTELIAKRNAALAQLASAEAQWRNAGIQYSREVFSPQAKSAPGGMGMPNLFDQMFTKPAESFFGQRSQGAERSADLYSSGVRIEQARNQIMQVQSEIRAVDAKLRDARSEAPFNGVIMKKFVEVGDTMQPGQPLLVFADVEYLQMEVDVPARLRPGLQDGMMLQAELDVGGQMVPVRVAQIFPMADAQRHTVKVKLDLPQGMAAPGMYAKVLVPDLTAPAREAPVIPTTAIRYNGSLPAVYVVAKNGEAELRMIRVGENLSGGFTTVLSGLAAGERILRDPPASVAAGWAPAEPRPRR
jgi:multidrug efflux pump subunit AcrA (membrane-fusion protein)